MEKLTIRDIAKLANTSKSTVSRYLNGIKVKEEASKSIERVIEEINYFRNSHARMLVTRKTMTIGVVVEDIANKFFMGIFKGIEEFVNKMGYHCVYYSWSRNYSNEEEFLRLVPEEQADALIFITFNTRSQRMLSKVCSYRYPVVLIGDTDISLPICTVDIDNYSGIRRVIDYLKLLGHKDMVYISGPSHIAAVKKRLASFEEAIDINSKLNVVETDFSNLSGYYAMKELLKKRDFTAVICASDEVAIGAMLAIKEEGIDIPDELSLVGFDNLPEAGFITPGLTTVNQPLEKIGRTAAELLFKQLMGEDTVKKIHYIEPELVIRKSVGAVNKS